MAKMLEVIYKGSKVSNPGKVNFRHFQMLKRYVKDNVRPTKPISRKRPIPYWSANFFDDLDLNMEDEAFWANNREGFNHEPEPGE